MMRDRPYSYPEDMDARRALAVYMVMHGESTDEAWMVLDDWVCEVGTIRVLQEISRILDHNDLDATEQAKELTRWQTRIRLRDPR